MLKKLGQLPQKPGVYLFKDAQGEVLYVGKAKNLKKRVQSYFRRDPQTLARTALMLARAADLDYIIVSSELESLVLENNLIKQYRPRFNVRMRDDKNYQFIKIDYDSEIPQIYPVRKILSDSRPAPSYAKRGRRVIPSSAQSKAKYFGPYTSGLAVRRTLKFISRVFSLCRAKKVSTRPCFAYHLGRCPGVCVGKISLASYRQGLKLVASFLGHRESAVLKILKTRMAAASRVRKFEQAARLRDQIQSLEALWERQKIVTPKKVFRDYFSLCLAGKTAVVNLFMVREGRLIHQGFFEVEKTEAAEPSEILNSFLKQYYGEASHYPREVVIPYHPADKSLMEKLFRFKFTIPRRGNKLKLLMLGAENARDYCEKNLISPEKVLSDLQSLLHLPSLPQRIEAYDISNIQGFMPVGSMVVFFEGQPQKSAYRKFKINLKTTPDDVAMMKEMLKRRFQKNFEPETAAGEQPWPMPDLAVIDGGRGQLNVALKVMRDCGLKIPVIGLAKRLEEIFLPRQKASLKLPGDSPVLHLLQNLRDEAHRFALAFYGKRHRKFLRTSSLDEIPGIGPKTRKKLLRQFGSLPGIKSASLETLSQAVGEKTAVRLKEQLP